jgi:lipopolysaccharide export LptBFGC system permease protein LptF
MACMHTAEERTRNARLAIGEAFTSWLIPLTMAFLSVTLGYLANRSLNMVLGGFFTIYGIFHLAKCPLVHISNKPSVYQLLLSISIVVVTALIFWYAWSWQFS